ncbi:hypothetical protein NLO413_0096 [Candidatus Neoehrlichia lotoris str. RAC413]|uniref:Uncharacterized protein n=1 Tax=Candidatus Neoehrlichia procyonis str. RAC413 TaxID=1359163 RepID=A0A0F3NL26_9RICK|nr:hypothetical protein NLO413_0096 [Candidatus Neoehrlichia lotoris str. RAC413]
MDKKFFMVKCNFFLLQRLFFTNKLIAKASSISMYKYI